MSGISGKPNQHCLQKPGPEAVASISSEMVSCNIQPEFNKLTVQTTTTTLLKDNAAHDINLLTKGQIKSDEVAVPKEANGPEEPSLGNQEM